MAKRYSQPQGNARIDWGNPITKGLVGAYLPQGINAVTNAAAVSITAPKTATKQGSGLLFAGGTEVAKYDSYQPSVPFTALTLLVPNFSSASATRQGVWVYQATSGSAQNRLRLIWLNATNGFYLDINGGFAYRCKPTFAAGDAIALAYTRAGVTSSNQFYVNGVAATTTQVVDTSNTGLPSPAAPLWLGDDVEFASGKRLNGTIALHLHFARVLTDAEIKSLSANPWQIFAPAARSIWVPVAAGGGSTGTLATTNANDTSAASGTTTVTGSLAKTNSSDTSSASGTTTVTGSLANTNANDTSSASGTTTVIGTLAKTNANDACVASGEVGGEATGTVAYTNANDTAAASGWAGTITGTLTHTNNNDTSAASGVSVTGGGLKRYKHYRKGYLKRGNEVLVFDSEELAEQYEAAEIEAAQVINRAQRRKARIAIPKPAAKLDIAQVEIQAAAYEIPANVPNMVAALDYEQLVMLTQRIADMQEEEDLELLLL